MDNKYSFLLEVPVFSDQLYRDQFLAPLFSCLYWKYYKEQGHEMHFHTCKSSPQWKQEGPHPIKKKLRNPNFQRIP